MKPWLDPSKHAGHSDGKEVLPWFRVMTLSDPHYVRAYAVGTWWLRTKNLDAAFAVRPTQGEERSACFVELEIGE